MWSGLAETFGIGEAAVWMGAVPVDSVAVLLDVWLCVDPSRAFLSGGGSSLAFPMDSKICLGVRSEMSPKTNG